MKQISRLHTDYSGVAPTNPKTMIPMVLLRLIPGFVLLALIGGAIGYVGLTASNSLVNQLKYIENETAPQLVELSRLGTLAERLRYRTIDHVLRIDDRPALSETQAGQYLGQNDLIEIASIRLELDSAIDDLDAVLRTSEVAGIYEPNAIALVADIKELRQQIYFTADALIQAAEIGSPEPLTISLVTRLNRAHTDSF